tara:strand:- start:345 stop:503 length:159 start_codon:yes stop_codon:yes gene_type:complete
MKYVLKNDWISPSGKTFKKGQIMDLTQELIDVLDKVEVKKEKKENKINNKKK